MDETELAKLHEAQLELLALSSSITDMFEKIRLSKEASAAEDALYVDQIKQLREAWEADESGVAFINTLNAMGDANEDLVDGLLKTHDGLAGLADGVLTEGLAGDLDTLEALEEQNQRYTDGLAALTEMERIAVTQAQEHTKTMLEEAAAADALVKAQKEYYLTLLTSMRDMYAESGYHAFVQLWSSLSDKAREDFITLYPEVAALATEMGETAEGATIFAAAIEKAANMDFTKFKEALAVDMVEKAKTDQLEVSRNNGFKNELYALETR